VSYKELDWIGPFWGQEIKEDHAISHEEPKPRSKMDKKWQNAMQQEIKALEKNRTWTLKELPEGKRPIDSKWVYNTKFKYNGEVERYKARVVAKGCTQRERVHYHATFAPVAKLVTIKTLLAVATKKGWIIHQLDVNNAFLHEDLDEEVYMKIPKGFTKEGETRVYKGEEEARVNATQYRRLVGRLLYLQATRPDVTYAVNVLSQFVSDPRQNRLEAAKQVLMYLKGTPRQGILLPREGHTTLTAYCDSNWLGFPFIRQDGPEQAARHIANNPVYHERTKHVEMDCLFVRERVETRDIEPKQIKSKLQLVDLLTKGLGKQQLRSLLNKMGIRDLHAPS
nr:putative copia-type protein [Tanacetum cinerariifolium]